ncbi:hypothetical protein Cal6303_3799 [Calothrix sp. PCC 6303]|nr:hypothetical protein Cal6303_3799 [Calothrix sp. PCC 6303]
MGLINSFRVAGEKKRVYTYVIRNNTLCPLMAITEDSGYTDRMAQNYLLR